jgi:protein kinase A
LIRQLLVRDPIARLGNLRGGTDDIKTHSFYSSLDHNALLAGSVAAPWVPTVKSLTDTSNFDPIDEAEPDYGNHFDSSGWDKDF